MWAILDLGQISPIISPTLCPKILNGMFLGYLEKSARMSDEIPLQSIQIRYVFQMFLLAKSAYP